MGESGEGNGWTYLSVGEEENPAWANYEQTGSSTTGPVGAFPGGQSPYGLMDMAGNVYEWSRDPWIFDYDCGIRASLQPGTHSASGVVTTDDSRALRGGCFKYADGARCAHRYGELCSYVSNQVGFRPVLNAFSRIF
jgi:formylglycine-generating enzyme required for sulfatase activity